MKNDVETTLIAGYGLMGCGVTLSFARGDLERTVLSLNVVEPG